MSLLTVNNLKVTFPVKGGIFGRTIDHIKAVDNVSFTINKGETLGLIGESGSGKSTIGKAIVGLNHITSGQILFHNINITKYIKKNKSHYRKNVQMIFQDVYSSLSPREKVIDIVAEPLRNFCTLTKEEELKRVHELLSIVGISSSASTKYPFEFSGGQRQRIGIARAIALNPQLIIADEPVSSLDISIQAQVLNYLKDIQQNLGIAYLFISHDLGVVKHMCNNLLIIHNSRFVEKGTKEDIFKNPTHVYTKRLIASIPNIDQNIRKQNFDIRKSITEEYKQNYSKYYDNNGNVYDLKRLTNTHYVAMR